MKYNLIALGIVLTLWGLVYSSCVFPVAFEIVAKIFAFIILFGFFRLILKLFFKNDL